MKKRILILSLVLMMLMVMVPTSSASDDTPMKNIFVDASNPNDGDGSGANPFKTINQAIKVATAGDIIVVAYGVYHESVYGIESGTEKNPTILMAAPGARPVLTTTIPLDVD